MAPWTLQAKSTIEDWITSLQLKFYDVHTIQYDLACGTQPVHAEADRETPKWDLVRYNTSQQ